MTIEIDRFGSRTTRLRTHVVQNYLFAVFWIKFVWSFSSSQSTVNTVMIKRIENGSRNACRYCSASAVAIRFSVSIHVKRVRSIHILTQVRACESQKRKETAICLLGY